MEHQDGRLLNGDFNKMAHYAQLDENNIVINVLFIDNENCLDENGQETEEAGLAYLIANGFTGRYVKTSYNSKANVHYKEQEIYPTPSGKSAFRKNYAGIGDTYDPDRDAFITPKPPDDPNNPDRYTLDEDTCIWIDKLSKDIKIGVTRI